MLVSLTVSPALLAQNKSEQPESLGLGVESGRLAARVRDGLAAPSIKIYDSIRLVLPEAYYSVDAEQSQDAITKQNADVALISQAQKNVRTANKLVAAALANAADVALVGKKMAAEGITATVYTKGHSDVTVVVGNGRNPAAAETRAHGARANVEDRGSPVDYSAAKTHTGAHGSR